jgi:hypothetical protein
MKRRERAGKQKLKLKDYESKIKTEAEAIEVNVSMSFQWWMLHINFLVLQELKKLGIDPGSLFALKDDSSA